MNSAGVHSLEPVRISVILPAASKGWTEGWVHAFLKAISSLNDSTSTLELIVIDAETTSRVGDHIESCFRDKALRVERTPRSRDWGWIRNQGAQKARGHTLAFINPWDQPKDLESLLRSWLEHLKYHDLFLVTPLEPSYQSHLVSTVEFDDPIHAASLRTDPLLKLILKNSIWTSGSWIKRTLFEQAGGFDSGGVFLEEYAFWLKVLSQTSQNETLKRIHFVTDSKWIDHKNAWAAEAAGLALPLPDRFFENAFALRERATLIASLRFLPKKYWKEIGSRITGLKPKLL